MLRLIRKGETTNVPLGDTVFKVRLQAHGEARKLRVKHSKRGLLDEEAMSAEFWTTHLVGWENLANGEARERIPFADGLVLEVVDSLPDDVITLLTRRIREPQIAVSEALGNSPPSSVSGS